MKGILSYESKLFSALDTLANTMLLNALFLIFCIPVFTIGAAYTALYSGCRALAKKEPCFKAFFRGFTGSFKRATLAWVILFPLIILFAFNTVAILFYKMDGYIPPLIMSAVVTLLLLSLTTQTFVFYSRFECTLGQLLKNSLIMVVAHPLRSLILGALSWLPILMFFLMPDIFMQLLVAWLFLYFAGVATVAVWLMNKPFRRLAIELLGEEALAQGGSDAPEEDASEEDDSEDTQTEEPNVWPPIQ